MRKFKEPGYHLIAALSGEGLDVSYAMIRVDAELLDSARTGITLLELFYGKYVGYGGLYRQGMYLVVFFKDFPAAFDMERLEGDVYKGGAFIRGLDEEAFEMALAEEDLDVRSEMTGYAVGTDSFRIVGYEKHGDQCLESDNLLPLMLIPNENEHRNENKEDALA